MGKVCKVIRYIFAIGVLIALIAGACAFVGYVVALIVGGTFAAELCTFLYGQFLPVVIQLCSISVGFGLISMYLGKQKALSFSGDENEQGK